jgi:radical SAM/Cys-rich protein
MNFRETVLAIGLESLRADTIQSLQVNLGYRCNMSCRHCHVRAGPLRTESMDKTHIETVLRVLGQNGIGTIDITGGAPELQPHFRYMVEEARRIGCRVIVRTNLTVFCEGGMEGLMDFLADQQVELIASLPWYRKEQAERTRGPGTFEKSIAALQMLNDRGYGKGLTGLILTLASNPGNADLPGSQESLEREFRRELAAGFGITFNRLYALTNMPVGRFREFLLREGKFDAYMALLRDAMNEGTLDGLMCRHQLNIGWDGRLYDCDFNQMIGLGLDSYCPQNIDGFNFAALSKRAIALGDHCFGCIAARGSS